VGAIGRHPIEAWRIDHGLVMAIETGTWKGDGVAALLRAGYARVVTIDVDPAAGERALSRADVDASRVDVVCGDSAQVLGDVLARWTGPALVWLDAHYPSAYGALGTELPLLAEVRALAASGRRRDLVVADDLRIYGAPASTGPLPEESGDPLRRVPLRRGGSGELAEVTRLLSATHDLQFTDDDGGYLVALPRHG
jgi:hypothetical protein